MSKYRPYRVISPAQKNKEEPKASFKLTKVHLFVAGISLLILMVGAAEISSAKAAAIAEQAQRKQKIESFQKQLPGLLNDQPQVSFHIYISDSRHDPITASSKDKTDDAASTAKLITACAALNLVEKDRLSLSKQIDGVKVSELIKLMIKNSDDNAWASLNGYLTHEHLADYAANIGLSSYNPDSNTITVADMNLLTSLLYEGQLLNSQDTKLLLSFMQNTNYEDFISPAMKQFHGLKFYHKVGANEDQVNDAAIISSGDNSLYITIYTNGHGYYNWAERATLMQKISTAAVNSYLY